jgi:hypothetical protein
VRRDREFLASGVLQSGFASNKAEAMNATGMQSDSAHRSLIVTAEALAKHSNDKLKTILSGSREFLLLKRSFDESPVTVPVQISFSIIV